MFFLVEFSATGGHLGIARLVFKLMVNWGFRLVVWDSMSTLK